MENEGLFLLHWIIEVVRCLKDYIPAIERNLNFDDIIATIIEINSQLDESETVDLDKVTNARSTLSNVKYQSTKLATSLSALAQMSLKALECNVHETVVIKNLIYTVNEGIVLEMTTTYKSLKDAAQTMKDLQIYLKEMRSVWESKNQLYPTNSTNIYNILLGVAGTLSVATNGVTTNGMKSIGLITAGILSVETITTAITRIESPFKKICVAASLFTIISVILYKLKTPHIQNASNRSTRNDIVATVKRFEYAIHEAALSFDNVGKQVTEKKDEKICLLSLSQEKDSQEKTVSTNTSQKDIICLKLYLSEMDAITQECLDAVSYAS